MIFGDKQQAVKYTIVDGVKFYYDVYNEIIDMENYNICTAYKFNGFVEECVLDRSICRVQRTPDINAIFQSCNLYAYCANNPVIYVDKKGEALGAILISTAPKWVPWVIAGVTAVASMISVQLSNNQKGLEKGMSKNQKKMFQREIEDYKRGEGRGPRDNLPWEILVELAEYVREYYK